MIRRLVLMGGLTLLVPPLECVQQRSFFGVVARGIYLPPDGDRFLGYSEDNRFVSLEYVFAATTPTSDPIAQTIDSWCPLGAPLKGLTSDGRSVEVKVDSVPEPSGVVAMGMLSVSLPADAKSPVLFWTGDL